MLSLQWHEWEHIIGILPLLIRCLLQGIAAPNTLRLIHSLPGMDRAFVFKLWFFYSLISSITWESPSPPPMHGPLFGRTTRGHAVLNVAVVASPPVCVCASGSAWSCRPPGWWSWCSLLCTSSRVYGVLHFWFQRGEYDCGQSSRASSRDVQRCLAGTSLAGSWSNPRPGFLFHCLV